jgi:hypothetical protein
MFNSKKSSQPFTMDNFIKQLHKISTHLSYIYSPFTDIEFSIDGYLSKEGIYIDPEIYVNSTVENVQTLSYVAVSELLDKLNEMISKPYYWNLTIQSPDDDDFGDLDDDDYYGESDNRLNLMAAYDHDSDIHYGQHYPIHTWTSNETFKTNFNHIYFHIKIDKERKMFELANPEDQIILTNNPTPTSVLNKLIKVLGSAQIPTVSAEETEQFDVTDFKNDVTNVKSALMKALNKHKVVSSATSFCEKIESHFIVTNTNNRFSTKLVYHLIGAYFKNTQELHKVQPASKIPVDLYLTDYGYQGSPLIKTLSQYQPAKISFVTENGGNKYLIESFVKRTFQSLLKYEEKDFYHDFKIDMDLDAIKQSVGEIGTMANSLNTHHVDSILIIKDGQNKILLRAYGLGLDFDVNAFLIEFKAFAQVLQEKD